MVIKWSREDSWVAYVLFLTNRKQFLRYVYVYVAYWTFLIFGRGKNASDEIIWRTPCSTSADPLGVADPRLKTSALDIAIKIVLCTRKQHKTAQSIFSQKGFIIQKSFEIKKLNCSRPRSICAQQTSKEIKPE